VLEHALSDSITVLSSYQERQTVISLICQCLEHILNAVAQYIQRWVKPDNPSLFADAALDLTRSKTELILENAFLPQQLTVLNRQVKRPALKPHEHVLLVVLTSRLRPWKHALTIVTCYTSAPATFCRPMICSSAHSSYSSLPKNPTSYTLPSKARGNGALLLSMNRGIAYNHELV